MKRVSQPPIDPIARPSEDRHGWLALALAIAGLLLLLRGAAHQTDVDTVEGESAREHQLIKAFSSGGLKYPSAAALLDPSVLNDPAAAVAAFERLDRERSEFSDGKPRVNTSAIKPCPT